MNVLRKLEQEATPAPWRTDFLGTDLVVHWVPQPGLGMSVAWWPSESWGEMGREGADARNAVLIAAARNALPYLLDVVEAAQQVQEFEDGTGDAHAEFEKWANLRRATVALDAHLRGER